jgi:coniferyl-aldehyde dehydrogenase
MQLTLANQQAANIRLGPATAEQRISLLDKSIDLLLGHGDALCDAMRTDFGHRSLDQSKFSDITSSIDALKYARKHLRGWMRPESRSTQFPLALLGAKARVHYQPKGVVGIISPWNFPVNLTFAPLAGVLAAGNRAMIKPSEYTPHTSQLLAELIGRYYAEDEVAVVTGDAEIGAAFAGLPLDHIVFTGATTIARHVMRSASQNLVPVTLELGGKSPVIVGASANMEKTALRTLSGKVLNAGQVCLAPDYVLLPENRVDEFAAAAQSAVAGMFPGGIMDNDDYTSIVNERHFSRLHSHLEDARNKGAKIIDLSPAGSEAPTQVAHKIPPCLIRDVSDDMSVMQDEIFGPLLPIRAYREIDEAIAFVNSRPRPLGLYYFGTDKTERDLVLNQTISGGVTVNDVFFHVSQEDLPFGGIGASGMGAYHGEDGFREFSHRKAVYTQTSTDVMGLFRPPYGEKLRKFVASRLKS